MYLLPHEDSNLDKQNQNLSYCHYTMGQSFLSSGKPFGLPTNL